MMADRFRKHISLTVPPGEGWEHFRSRGIGSDNVSCFVCGENCFNNIAAFVRCEEAGERIVKMFGRGAWLDYRPHEPSWIQVKIGACKEHLSALGQLHEITQDERITKERITICVKNCLAKSNESAKHE